MRVLVHSTRVNIVVDKRKHPDAIESWRAIPGFEGFYEVSNFGRVRSLPRIRTSGLPLRGKILKQGSVSHG